MINKKVIIYDKIMDKKEMLDDLNKQAEDLKNKLLSMEQEFNQKKEQFIRIQGAIEALTMLDSSTNPEPPDHTEAAKALGI
tara:strand:+ start:11978 stop:12220 length:243 start_codon:yes stop_codon:yes gene_type:complete